MVLAAALAGASTPAAAATIRVTTTRDAVDAAGDCSLREALAAADTDTAVDGCRAGRGQDRVRLRAATYPVEADLVVHTAVTIAGARRPTRLTGAGTGRILLVEPTADVTVSRLTLAGGNPNNGGGSEVGGGVLNEGALTLRRSTVTGSSTGCCSAGGGGIANFGSLTVLDSTISANSAGGEAGFGGGILNSSPGAMLPFTPTLTVRNSTISANTAGDAGDAFSLAQGGGIANYGAATVTDTTIAFNAAQLGQGAVLNAGTLTPAGTILADNTAALHPPACAPGISAGAVLRYDGCPPGGTGDPRLGPLGDNGGPTATHALLAGSAAVDAGGHAGTCAPRDQRGVPRPQDGDGDGMRRCDIGAFERRTLRHCGRLGRPLSPRGRLRARPALCLGRAGGR